MGRKHMLHQATSYKSHDGKEEDATGWNGIKWKGIVSFDRFEFNLCGLILSNRCRSSSRTNVASYFTHT